MDERIVLVVAAILAILMTGIFVAKYEINRQEANRTPTVTIR